MNRLISGLQNVFVRVILTLSLVGIAFLASAALGYGNSFQAQAGSLTPEATGYELNSNDSALGTETQEKANQLFKDNKQPLTAPETTQEIGETISEPAKNAKQAIEGFADNIREKLNLDQPLYPGTKEVLDDAADAITGNQD